jgi:hypothetical protein
MGSFFLFVLKPIWYAIAFALGARWLKSDAPHWRLPNWAIIILATIARYAAGWGLFFVGTTLSHTFKSGISTATGMQIVAAFGFAAWWLTARVAFRRASGIKILLFTLLAELMSGAIDYWAFRDLQHINMC